MNALFAEETPTPSGSAQIAIHVEFELLKPCSAALALDVEAIMS
jgi:hypothetical protein